MGNPHFFYSGKSLLIKNEVQIKTFPNISRIFACELGLAMLNPTYEFLKSVHAHYFGVILSSLFAAINLPFGHVVLL